MSRPRALRGRRRGATKRSDPGGCRGHKGKRRFKDKPQAVGALHVISSRGEKREKTPVRAYECEFCKGWFLTSRAAS